MSGEMDEARSNELQRPAQIVMAVMNLLLFVSPICASLVLGSGWIDTILVAPLWIFEITRSRVGFRIDTFWIQSGIFLDIPRTAFVYWMHRYFTGKTSRTRTIFVGIVAEMTPLILSLPILITVLTSPYNMYLPFLIPIPILLVTALVVIRRVPAPDIYTPWEGFYESPDWWETEAQENHG